MSSLFSAIMFLLLLRIAYGSTEEYELPVSTRTVADCNSRESTRREECLRQFCIRFVQLCRRGTDCNPRAADCFNLVTNPLDGSHAIEIPKKRGSFTRNSYLFMKLHPVLNRAVDANLINVPARYRRIGVRLGSEFLGKRSGGWETEDVTRGRRIPGTELLGKRYDEMIAKRGIEFLGKRGNEFLGKRGNEFLGKRGSEFLGKRGSEFLGKRGNELLGKRGNELLGKRGNEFLGGASRLFGRSCGVGEDCSPGRFPPDSKVLVQYYKVTAGTEIGNPEMGFNGLSNSPNRFRPTRFGQNSGNFPGKLGMS